MKWLHRSYSRPIRMAILVGAILGAYFLSTNISNYRSTRKMLRQSLIENVLPMTSNSICSDVKLELLSPVIASSRLANDLFIREWIADGEKDRDKLIQYLDEVRSEFDAVTSFLVSEPTRTYYGCNGELYHESEDDPAAAWYFRFRDSDRTYELNTALNIDMNDMPTVFINYRMSDGDGQFMGVTGLGLRLASLPGILGKYSGPLERNIYFVDSTGSVITRSRGAAIQKDNLREVPGLAAVADSLLAHQLEFFEHELDGRVMLVNGRFIPELEWWVLVEQEESRALVEVHRGLIQSVLMELGAITFTLILVIRTIMFFHKRLELLATTDRLTGVSNRQVFSHILKQALAQRRRNGMALSVILADIDHFKKVNDSLGHLAGDRVLKEVARVMQTSIREADHLSRWGGEEFVILAYDCGLAQACAVADVIRKAVESADLTALGNTPPVTVSIGVSEAVDGDTGDSVLDRADRGLYKAKEDGRNCVRSCSAALE